MNLTFVCRQCERTARVDIESSASEFRCPHCDHCHPTAAEIASGDRIDRCLVCGCGELYIRKDFSQRLGITIVVIGLVSSSIAWGWHRIYLTYSILFATAFVDVVLYLTVGNLLQCYRCSSIYRDLVGLEEHAPFELETHERFRQQKARSGTSS